MYIKKFLVVLAAKKITEEKRHYEINIRVQKIVNISN